MSDRRDTLLASQTQDVAAACSRRLQELCRRAVVTLMLCASINSVARLQVLADDEDDIAPVAAAADRRIVISERQFDLMAFGRGQRIAGVQAIQIDEQTASETEARKRLNSQLSSQVQAMDRLYSLSDAQKKKLQLAGKGDIHQHFSRLFEMRLKVTAAPLQREQFVELMKELQPIQNVMQEHIFGEESLFQKTLRNILTEEQRVRHRSIEREQQRKIIEGVMLDWDRTADRFKLWGEPRKQFIELLVPHLHVPVSAGSYSHQLVFLEAWRLREQVKPLLTADEWKKFEWQVERAKEMRPTLEARGLWTTRFSDDADEASPDATKE